MSKVPISQLYAHQSRLAKKFETDPFYAPGSDPNLTAAQAAYNAWNAGKISWGEIPKPLRLEVQAILHQ